MNIATEALLSKDLKQLQWNGKAAYAAWYAGSASKPKDKRSKKAAAATTPEAREGGDQPV